MKFSIPREALDAAANRVRPAASGRGDTDGMIRLTAGADGTLRLEATDGTLTVRTSAAATVTDPGVVVVPSKVFCATVSFLAGDVECRTDASSLHISDAAGHTSITAVAADQFTETAQPDSSNTSTFAAGELAKAVRSVERAALRERSNYPGVLFDDEGGSLRLVATDSYCLALVETGLPALPTTPFVPAAELRAAMKVLDATADVAVSADETRIAFDDGTTSVTVALLATQFPAYRPLLATKSVSTVKSDASNLAAAVNRVRTVLVKSELTIRLDGSPDKGLEVSAESKSSGSSTVEVPGAEVDGETLTATVNPMFIVDALASLGSEITISWQQPDRAFVMASTDTRWYVMPTKPTF